MWVAVYCAVGKCGARVSMGDKTCQNGHELVWKWRTCAHCQDRISMPPYPSRWFDQCPKCYVSVRRASVNEHGLTFE